MNYVGEFYLQRNPNKKEYFLGLKSCITIVPVQWVFTVSEKQLRVLESFPE